MKNVLLIVCILAVSVVSCRPAYIRHGLKDIREERARLEMAKGQFETLDTGQVHDIYKSYLAKIDSINKYFKDQYSESAWQLMTEFGQLKKPLKTYFEQYKTVENEYQYSFEQLANLEFDLKEKNVSNEQYTGYIKTERDANEQLIVKSNMISENAARNVNRFNTLGPKIDSLVIIFKSGNK